MALLGLLGPEDRLKHAPTKRWSTLPLDKAEHPRRLWSSLAMLWYSQISQLISPSQMKLTCYVLYLLQSTESGLLLIVWQISTSKVCKFLLLNLLKNESYRAKNRNDLFLFTISLRSFPSNAKICNVLVIYMANTRKKWWHAIQQPKFAVRHQATCIKSREQSYYMAHLWDLYNCTYWKDKWAIGFHAD
jgi:hypothetical protein